MFPPDASPPEINGMKPSVSLQVSSYLTAPCVARTDCEVSCGNLAYLNSMTNSTLTLRKEVIQPHLPIRLPCYDFTPVIGSTFGSSLLRWVTDFGHIQLPWRDGRCVQDPGTYSPRHSDSRLLAIPASCSRVADYNPNWDGFFGICPPSRVRFPLWPPL